MHGLTPAAQRVEELNLLFRSVARMYTYWKQQDAITNLATFSWQTSGKPAALPIDLICDVEVLVKQCCGSSYRDVLLLLQYDWASIDETTQVALAITFDKAQLLQHYRPVFTNRRAKSDLKDASSLKVSDEITEETTSDIAQVLSSGSTDEALEEIPEVNNEASALDWFGDQDAA